MIGFSDIEYLAIGLLLKLNTHQREDVSFREIVSQLNDKLTAYIEPNGTPKPAEENISLESGIVGLFDETTVLGEEKQELDVHSIEDTTLVAPPNVDEQGTKEPSDKVSVHADRERGRAPPSNSKKTKEFYRISKAFVKYGLNQDGEPNEIDQDTIHCFNLERLSELIGIFQWLCRCDNNYKLLRSMRVLLRLLKRARRIMWDSYSNFSSHQSCSFNPIVFIKPHIFGRIQNCYLLVIQITNSNCLSLSNDEIFNKFRIIITMHHFLLRSYIDHCSSAKRFVTFELIRYLDMVRSIVLITRGSPERSTKRRNIPRYLEIVQTLQVTKKVRNKLEFLAFCGIDDVHVYYLIYYLLKSIGLIVDLIHELGFEIDLETQRQSLLACLIYYENEELILSFQQIRFNK